MEPFPPHIALGDRIDALRAAAGLSIAECAKGLGLTARDYRVSVLGRHDVPASIVLRASLHYGASLDTLINGAPGMRTDRKGQSVEDTVNIVRRVLSTIHVHTRRHGAAISLNEHQRWAIVHELMIEGAPRGRGASSRRWTMPDEEAVVAMIERHAAIGRPDLLDAQPG